VRYPPELKFLVVFFHTFLQMERVLEKELPSSIDTS